MKIVNDNYTVNLSLEPLTYREKNMGMYFSGEG